MAFADMFKARLSESEIDRVHDTNAAISIWRSAPDGRSRLLRDVRIAGVTDENLTLAFPDGHHEDVPRRSLFVPAKVLRRINLDGPMARVFDALTLVGW